MEGAELLLFDSEFVVPLHRFLIATFIRETKK